MRAAHWAGVAGAWIAAMLVCMALGVEFVVSWRNPELTVKGSWWLFLILMLAAVVISIVFELQTRIESQLGGMPPLPQRPDPPHGLNRPELCLPRFEPPPVPWRTAPPKHIPGAWTNCNVCGRPLTDPMSRYRGVGPTCFGRTGRYYPQGPVNPKFRVWQLEVERLTPTYDALCQTARTDFDDRVGQLTAEHADVVARWEADVDGRALLQAEYEAVCRDYATERARASRIREQFNRSPQARSCRVLKKMHVFLIYVAAGRIAISVIVFVSQGIL